jgi:hypothetical protein
MVKDVNKSEVIRTLAKEGKTVVQIRDETGYDYNLIYNVLSREGRPKGNHRNAVSHQIRVLHAQGKTRREIMDELKCTHQHIYNALKNYKSD